ncbi:LysE family translocator [Streptomyces sp. URMC 123]|uniref:LysE family translocator n=1 Tax=Streptomyces sp. URMC 123 TaxID=3423403 RepID=UPI003F1E1A61
MINSTDLWSFLLVVGLLTLTPGLDTALVLRTAVVGRRRAAWGVVLGIQTGALTWGVLTSLGVTALLTASHLAYEVLRWAGAAYLVWMGVRILMAARRRSPGGEPGAPAATPTASTAAASDPGITTAATAATAPAAPGPRGALRAGWRQGVTTNLLNPKVGAFYVAVLPQFIPADASHVIVGTLLSGIHVLIGLIWFGVLIACAHALRGGLSRPAVRRALDRVSGAVIAGFGIRLAFGD